MVMRRFIGCRIGLTRMLTTSGLILATVGFFGSPGAGIGWTTYFPQDESDSMPQQHDETTTAKHAFTNRLINERKRYRGKIVAVGDEAITVERDQPAEGEPGAVEIPFDAIGEARLILTDDLIAAALKADKSARKARGDVDPDAGDDEAGASEH